MPLGGNDLNTYLFDVKINSALVNMYSFFLIIDTDYKTRIEELNNKIKELQSQLGSSNTQADNKQHLEFENKIKELTETYELEKSKNEKANIKLRSYKDKILKCAACINQLKNSRFILTKTVKEYSANIPKWQDDILKASKVLEEQINNLTSENNLLKNKLQIVVTSEDSVCPNKVDALNTENSSLRNVVANYQKQLEVYAAQNIALTDEHIDIKSKYQELNETKLPSQMAENELLRNQVEEITHKLNDLTGKNNELKELVKDLKIKNQNLTDSLQNQSQYLKAIEHLNLQIKALESEKAILVKEKLNARDHMVDMDHQNKTMTEQLKKLQSEVLSLKTALETLSQEKSTMEVQSKTEKEGEIKNLMFKIMSLQEQYNSLKKEHENLQDLNNLLKEEVDTLKLSLEQPKDDADNLSDLNVSLQADIVKLETKLSAYKQENASLLTEMKESRAKAKEFDTLLADYEDAKSKLVGYKTENTELLNEMKEINQVLKERGEAISKLQKAVAEMETLIETLEKDRHSTNQEKDVLNKKISNLENDLKNAKQRVNKNSEEFEHIVMERDNAVKALSEKETVIALLKDEIEKLKQQQTSTGKNLHFIVIGLSSI